VLEVNCPRLNRNTSGRIRKREVTRSPVSMGIPSRKTGLYRCPMLRRANPARGSASCG
jgi:hypothetical protein